MHILEREHNFGFTFGQNRVVPASLFLHLRGEKKYCMLFDYFIMKYFILSHFLSLSQKNLFERERAEKNV